MGRSRRVRHPVPLHSFVQFRGVPYPRGWEAALVGQDFKCWKCGAPFRHGRKADFHHEGKLLTAVCSKCNDILHGGAVQWPSLKRRRKKRA